MKSRLQVLPQITSASCAGPSGSPRIASGMMRDLTTSIVADHITLLLKVSPAPLRHWGGRFGVRGVIGWGQVTATMESWLPLFFCSQNSVKVNSNYLECQCRLGGHKREMGWGCWLSHTVDFKYKTFRKTSPPTSYGVSRCHIKVNLDICVLHKNKGDSGL